MTDIRPATDEDLPGLARLRWRWVDELGGATGTRDDYEQHFVAWARDHESTHLPVLAETGGTLVGMAWVAHTPRLPSPGRLDRFNAEVQSVYVVPEARNRGIGTALITAAVDAAPGAERVIVHSSESGLAAYHRAGFAPSPLQLERHEPTP